jgi:hypothetical protein
VVFVADALGGWLVGQLADAGRKKLTELVLGSEQQRALRRAADAAVWATAEELSPCGGEQAEQAAMVISEVFRDPAPDAPLAGPVMLLEGLQAGIAGQLAVLDDAGLTGTGQSSADVLGAPGTVLADRLTGHLVREIIVRGSGGGPLTPLADQFNHELTRLQIKGMFAWLAAQVRDALPRPDRHITVAGRPLAEVTDPFVLEVHRPVRPEDVPPGLPVLPPYVPREHDEVLGQVARAAAGGRSGIAVLVGGSSTGKTRACWEALALLRDRDPPWRLWHPIDPSRPDAALAELPGIGSRTVVWLNEAQFYLDVPDGLGEQVAAGLRELLRDPGRAPVLVLATMWPRFWDALTARPADGDDPQSRVGDPRAQARELLAGHDITVPAAFTPAQMSQLARAVDARMVLAVRSARDREVIQFLAGAPELLARYRNAEPAAKALIDAAMDARRLGMGAGLPLAFLEAAAPAYLTDAEWDALGEEWLQQALAYTAVPCKGVRGPLTRIRPRAARSRTGGSGSRNSDEQPAGDQSGVAGRLLYRLADYLDQHGRAHRAGQIPSSQFWSAAAAHAAPGDQAALGDAAHDRGLYRDAAQLHKNAAASGNPRSAHYLIHPPACLRADPRPAHWAAAHAALDDPDRVADLLASLRAAGAERQAAVLADRAAAHAPLYDPGAVANLLDSLREAGAHDQAATLLTRDPAAHATLDDADAVDDLLDILLEAGAHEQAATLAERAATHVPLHNPATIASLLDMLLEAGAGEQAAVLAERAAAHVSLDHPGAVGTLLASLWQAGTEEHAEALLRRYLAAQVPLDNPGAAAVLLDILREAGAHEQAAVLAERAAAQVPPDRPGAVGTLLASLRAAGAERQAVVLAERAAADSPLHEPVHVAMMLDMLRAAGAERQAAVLAERAAAQVSRVSPGGVAVLLASLRAAGAEQQAAALAERVAAHVPLHDPATVAGLLDMLWAAGAEQQAAVLAERAAAHATLDDPGGVAHLLDSLLEAGAGEQAAVLLARDPAAHATLDDPGGVAHLLASLLEAGAGEQAAVLLARDPAAHATLDDADAVADLLASLLEAGAGEQAAVLLARDPAAHATLDDADAVADLLDSLLEAGAHEQAAALTGRLPTAGMFSLFLQKNGPADRFHFGREADGTLAAPWGWGDLDLWLFRPPNPQDKSG